MARLHAAAVDAAVLTGAARAKPESVAVQTGRTQLIAVAASFGGLGMFNNAFKTIGLGSLAANTCYLTQYAAFAGYGSGVCAP